MEECKKSYLKNCFQFKVKNLFFKWEQSIYLILLSTVAQTITFLYTPQHLTCHVYKTQSLRHILYVYVQYACNVHYSTSLSSRSSSSFKTPYNANNFLSKFSKTFFLPNPYASILELVTDELFASQNFVTVFLSKSGFKNLFCRTK